MELEPTPILLTAGALAAALCVAVARLRRTARELRALALGGAPPGVWPVPAFTELVRAELARARRNGKPAALLRIELRAPRGGDAFLRALRAVRKMIRREDALCQLEDGELALLASGTPSFGALLLARRLRAAIEDAGAGSARVGLCEWQRECGADPAELLRRAGVALGRSADRGGIADYADLGYPTLVGEPPVSLYPSAP
jgi:GGDEF domain-containing protein